LLVFLRRAVPSRVIASPDLSGRGNLRVAELFPKRKRGISLLPQQIRIDRGRVSYFCDIIGARSSQIKVAKLPQVKGNRLVKALQKKGWYIDRSRGSHVIMRNDDKPGTKIVAPIHTSPVKPGTLSNILKKAEISKEELEYLL
jgi:predicted RNA binding protein YcfA (HicA-like mRNA interferase family)